MPKFDAIEEGKIIRTIKEWMIDDFAVPDIITQAMQKWSIDENTAQSLLEKATREWKEKEAENNEQKRLRKIDSLKKLKRSLKEAYKGTPAGIAAILNVEKELFRLEALAKGSADKEAPAKPEDDLTCKQERFCREYVIDFNGTQACKRAGYVSKTDDVAAVQAFRLLRNAKILKFIEKLQDELRRRAELTSDIVVKELRDLSEWNIQDFLNSDKSLKDLTSLPLKTTKPISGIKVTEKLLPDGTKQVTTELKLVDKRATWVDLGRHLGIFKEDNLQRPVVGGQMDDTQFEKLLQAAREAKADSSQ